MNRRMFAPYILGLIVALVAFVATLAVVAMLRGASETPDADPMLLASRTLPALEWQTAAPLHAPSSILDSRPTAARMVLDKGRAMP